jgi:hypothetical protein
VKIADICRMKKRFLFFTGSFLLTCKLSAQITSVLFLGNSYVGTNNLPDLFRQLALAGGDTVQYAANTPGGYTLQLHSQDVNTIAAISQQPWDFVIVQGQSQEPSLDSAYVANNVFPYATILDSLIEQNDPCTQTVFFMTWGRKFGDASNCVAYPPVCTYSGMQDQLRNRYVQMANDNGTMVSPVGACWQNAIAAGFVPDLYSSDQSHPALYGSYLAACSFYASIFKRSPVGLNYYAGLPTADAIFLQQIAEQTVLDSLPFWNADVYNPTAAFTVSPAGQNTISVSGTDNTAVSWLWDDGTGSGFVNGTQMQFMTYPNAGTYNVCLIAINSCGRTDTVCELINTATVGINEQAPISVQVYFSSTENALVILNADSRKRKYSIFDSQGRLITELISSETEIRLTNRFSSGIYLMRMADELGETVLRVLIPSN